MDLDQGGRNNRSQRIYDGPSLGWFQELLSQEGAPISVLDFGAVGDGFTDDAAAIAAAWVATPPGGTLIFPSGYTYLINSNHGPGQLVLPIRSTPITVDLNNSTVLIGTNTVGWAFNCAQNIPYVNNANLVAINNAAIGDTSITCTVAANAALFTPGHILYIQGETADNYNRAQNFITTVNPATGVVGLEFPLGKAYTVTPKAMDAESISCRGFAIVNGKIRWVGTTGASFALVQQAAFVRYENLDVDASLFVSNEPFENNALLCLMYKNNMIRTGLNGAIEFGGQGSVGGVAVGNILMTVNSHFGISGSPEGPEHFTFTSNMCFSTGDSSGNMNAMIDVTSIFNPVITNNTLFCGATASNGGWALITTNNGAAFPALNAVISNNILYMKGTVNAIVAGGNNDVISGNNIWMGNGVGINLTGNSASVTGNRIHVGASAIAIQVNATAPEGSCISGNLIDGGSIGILINDPGSSQPGLLTISGNECNSTNGILFGASARVNLPNAVVSGNTPGGTDSTSLLKMNVQGVGVGDYNVTTSGWSFNPSGAIGLQIIAQSPSAVNYIFMESTNTGNAPTIQARGADSSINITIAAKGAGGVVAFLSANQTAFSAVCNSASDVNALQASGSLTGVAPALAATGSDTNISLNIQSKGSGAINLFSNSQISLSAANTVSNAVNYIQTLGSAAGTAVSINAAGTDTNLGMNIQNKGAATFGVQSVGGVQILAVNTNTTAVNGWLFAGSNTGLPVGVAAAGSDSAIAVNIQTKGAGAINLISNGNAAASIQNTSASAVNYLLMSGGATTAPIVLTATGTDTNVSGNLTCKGAGTINVTTCNGFGYGQAGNGDGGVVTQATSKATGVTLSTLTGQITMNAAALAAATTVSFLLTNTKIAANDMLVLHHVSAGTIGAYTLNATPAAGSATINVRNVHTASLSEAIVIQFVLFKAVIT